MTAPVRDGVAGVELPQEIVQRTSRLRAGGLQNDPAYVMGQLGHTDPASMVRVYSHLMGRNDGERDRLRALVEGREMGTDWAPMGTSSHEPVPETSAEVLP